MSLTRTVRLIIFSASVALLGSGTASAQTAPYVGAYEADTFFPTITSNEMNVLRTKKILLLSRSFGLNMYDGLNDLKNQNSMYDILSGYVRYDIPKNTISSIPANAFSSNNFVHVLATYWPHTQRLNELDTLIRSAPYEFYKNVDVVMVEYHYALSSIFDTYTNALGKLQADYPNMKVVYVTAGFMDTNHVTENVESAAFNVKSRAAFQGKAPLYDQGYLLSNDDPLFYGYRPEYSTDPAGVHPNAPFAEQRLGKAFLLMLRDLYFGSSCTNLTPPSVPVVSGSPLSSSSVRITWAPSTHECGISRYEVARNGISAGFVTQTNYIDSGLTENTAYNYTVRAVSMADVVSAYSSTTTVTTLADSTAPTVVKATALSSLQISVEFSETLDSVSAQTATNYVMNNGITVFSAALSGKTVTLTVSEMLNGTTYTLSISGVKDASSAKNPVAAGTQTEFTYQAVTYPSDPTAYWSFDGNLNDLSGNGLNGLWYVGTNYGSGLFDQGLALNGATNGPYVQVNHHSLLDGMPQLTLSGWARKNDPAVGGVLFKKHALYKLEVGGNFLKVYLYAYNGTSTNAVNLSSVSVSGISDTNWHHYALVYNGTNLLTYVDGIRRSSNALTGAVNSNPARKLAIGKEDASQPLNTFAGDLDEMKLFRRALTTNEISGLFSAGLGGRADRAAVRSLLDANSLTNKQVDAISVYQNDRITKLYLQESGVTNITADIGRLSELDLLHVYGDRALGYPLLSQVSPEIGNCTQLTELLLSQNGLTNLPSAITNLTRLTICSIGDNFLCEADPVWESWADVYDSDWRDTQDCPSSLFYIYSILHGSGIVFPTNLLTVSAGQSTQLVYSANTWYELSGFLANGVSVPSAAGQAVYTAVYANVSADITNEVTFAVIKAPADGQTPATWYGPLGADPSAADEDQDGLSLIQEYLINSHPAGSNTFRMVSAGLGTDLHVRLSWQSMGLPNGQVQIGLQTDLNGTVIYPAGTVTYSNGICTWRSDLPVTNETGFVRLRISAIP